MNSNSNVMMKDQIISEPNFFPQTSTLVPPMIHNRHPTSPNYKFSFSSPKDLNTNIYNFSTVPTTSGRLHNLNLEPTVSDFTSKLGSTPSPMKSGFNIDFLANQTPDFMQQKHNNTNTMEVEVSDFNLDFEPEEKHEIDPSIESFHRHLQSIDIPLKNPSSVTKHIIKETYLQPKRKIPNQFK